MSSDESSEEVEVPKPTKGKRKSEAKPAKPAKKAKKSKNASSSDESSGVDDPTPVKKGAKPTEDADKPDPSAIALGKTRFATVSEFKGKKRVDIRDYYRNGDGKLCPTKKGISLSGEEFLVLKDNVDKLVLMGYRHPTLCADRHPSHAAVHASKSTAAMRPFKF